MDSCWRYSPGHLDGKGVWLDTQGSEKALLIRFPKYYPSDVGQRAQCTSGYGEVRIDGDGDLMRLKRGGWSGAHTTMKPPKAITNKQTIAILSNYFTLSCYVDNFSLS